MIRSSLWLFVTNREVPHTNTACGRALHPNVIVRKVTNGFRSIRGAQLFAAVRSVVDTGRQHDLSVLRAILATLNRTSLFINASRPE
jgi:transposase